MQAWLPQGIMLLAAFLFSIFWLVSMGLQSYESDSFSRSLALPSIDYMKIGKGPLAISPQGISPEFESLVKELVVLGKNTRPDSGALSTAKTRESFMNGQISALRSLCKTRKMV